MTIPVREQMHCLPRTGVVSLIPALQVYGEKERVAELADLGGRSSVGRWFGGV